MEHLKNNNLEMKTIVETFLTEETVALIYSNEELDKWNKHVEDLGLKGQTEITKPEKSPIPFMHLKTSYKNICETICPSKVAVEKYNITPIPVEILDLIALSKKEDYFSKIMVWYDDKSPDPFVIGSTAEPYCYDYDDKNPNELKGKKKKDMTKEEIASVVRWEFHDWDAKYYLIGKWADVKRSWKELKEMATERFSAERMNEYHLQIKSAKRGLEDLKTEAFSKFN